MDLLVNIDVSDLGRAIAFHTEAFGLTVTRRFGAEGAELSGWPVRVYLLQKPEGSLGAGESLRHYDRHWTPVHLDVVVDDVAAALSRAVAAGARAETDIRIDAWGKIVVLADPFGHGFCLIEFLGRGYDEISDPAGSPSHNQQTVAARQKAAMRSPRYVPEGAPPTGSFRGRARLWLPDCCVHCDASPMRQCGTGRPRFGSTQCSS
jgi:predicted enzyme related to lactoylglutathione lyase